MIQAAATGEEKQEHGRLRSESESPAAAAARSAGGPRPRRRRPGVGDGRFDGDRISDPVPDPAVTAITGIF
jgi:hypothetical protein